MRDDEDTVRVRRDSVGLGARRASSIFPTPDAVHAEVDKLDGSWREREAQLRRENERLRAERAAAFAERDRYRDAMQATQLLVEKRDKELHVLRRALRK